MSITLPLIMLPIDRWPPPLGDDPEEEVLVGESLEEEPFLDEPEVPARGSTPPPVVPALALSLLLFDDEGP